MADKSVPLSIVINAVDKATARIRAINARVDAATAPVRGLSKEFKKLQEFGQDAGLSQIADGFKGVGGAIKDLFGKLVVVGGVAAAAVFGVKSLVDEFANLGNTAKRVGTTVDFLAAMRFAATKSGASVEQLDQGLQAFTANLGQARAGTGRMAKFLGLVSPALLTQLKATESNEEAFKLLADAMAKVQDPAKRLALAQKTVGDVALAPLLARGSKGLLELQGQYVGLAGSQEQAAESATETESSMKDLGAATDGIKGALVQGLAPALKQIVERLKDWLVGHREDIARWAEDIGKKLPDAVQNVVEWVGKAYDKAKAFIDQIGGIKTVLIAVAAITLAPLASSIVTVVVGVGKLATAISAFGVAGGATAASTALALGQVLVTIAAITAGIYAATKAWEFLNASTGQRTGSAAELLKEGKLDGIDNVVTSGAADGLDGVDSVVHQAPVRKSQQQDVGSKAREVRDAVTARNPFSEDPQLRDAIIKLSESGGTQAKVTVDFANVPRGTRVSAAPTNTGDVDMSVGYQLLGLGA